ncbi:MAG: phytase [Saprospiraceae bacterium]|nr:phytase [Saprospiraceae bacterium]
MKINFLLVFTSLFLLASCNPVKRFVQASVETNPVKSDDDAADDPAIFVHPDQPEKSLIIGTNKQNGLDVYNLKGEQLQSYDFGLLNNVDLRSDFPLNNQTITIVGASNRTDNTISLFQLEGETGVLTPIAAQPLQSQVDEVYGFCLYQNGQTYAFVVGKDGQVEQWLLTATADDKVAGEVVRTFKLGGQCEGMVADDEMGYLYVGEEAIGVWKFKAAADADVVPTLVTDLSNNMLKEDIEGLSLYYAANGQGYLLVSSQGNNSYAVFERAGDNNYVGSFRIGDGIVDKTGETDGIDVINLAMGPAFPNGFFIAQDGFNYDGRKKKNQNFKLVPWERIANSFEPSLLIDNTYVPKR